MTSSKSPKWAWFLTTPAGKVNGFVHGVDPRDAVSRALTTPVEGGRLLGEVHSVPMCILDGAPGNGDLSYLGMSGDIALKVVRVPQNVLGSIAEGPFYVWANEDCANVTPDFDEAKSIRKTLLDEAAVDVYIVDADGMEVVDPDIEADEALRAATVAA